MLRFKKYLMSKKMRAGAASKEPATRSKARERERSACRLSVTELEEAEKAILRRVQESAFTSELEALKPQYSDEDTRQDPVDRAVKRRSSLRQLDPMQDDGLLRVGGRLAMAPLEFKTRNPVILPARHPVSELIVRHVHQQVGHQGRGHTLAALRETYWLIHGNAEVRRVLKQCKHCIRWQARPEEQKMADLSPDSVTPDQPVFSSVGVDLFGPFLTKRDRASVKRYGVIFTCLATRAIHIELADSMSTDSFLNALTRALEGGGILCPPHLFFANNLKTAARSAAKFGIPAHNS